MKPQDYTVVVVPLPDCDGGGYAGFVPDLPGCMGDGETHEEATQDALDAAQCWLDAAAEEGREIPEPGSSLRAHKDRMDALMSALKSAIEYAEHADDHIADLEAKMDTLIALMTEERTGLRVGGAVIASVSQRKRIAVH